MLVSKNRAFGLELNIAPANDDLGALIAFDLWELAEVAVNLADYSGDFARYEASLFRLTSAHRQLGAALGYLAIVEREGHEGYLSSDQVYGIEDAKACFRQAGAGAVAELLEQAEAVAKEATARVVGGGSLHIPDYSIPNRMIAALNPVDALRSFGRRYRSSFERW